MTPAKTSGLRARTRRLVRLCSAALILLGLLAGAKTAWAHDFDSASLSLNEVASGRFRVRFQASSATLREELKAPAVFPSVCRYDGAYLDCGASGLVGTIEFPWLEGTLTRVLVQVDWQNGSRLLRVLSPSTPSLQVYGVPAGGLRNLTPIVRDYTWLGVEHIVTGFDHLLFVVALALLVRGGAPLVATVTAFTLAHSVSLAATVLGVVSLPPPPVEAVIALSIVLVCAECLRPADSLTRRAPWLVAFAFGLLHGLGFASALLEIGLPERHVPLALACFNVGVELGQLAAIAVVAIVRVLARRLRLEKAWLERGLIYAMGGVAAFWCVDRLGAVIGVE